MKEELSENEKKLFGRLNSEKTPPAVLEERLIQQLISEKLIKKPFTTMTTYKKWAAYAAIALLTFLLGNYFGSERSGNDTINPLNGYMLLLHEDENFKEGDPNKMFSEYGQWMKDTFEKGVTITGQELANDAVNVDNHSEAKQLGENTFPRTTGYFILEARSMQEALEVARNNPHIKYGGSIEIKKFMVR